MKLFLRCFITLLCAATFTAQLCAQNAGVGLLPADAAQWGQSSWSTGSGQPCTIASLNTGVVSFTISATTLGETIDDMRKDAAVIDIPLLAPVPLAAGTDRLAFWARETTRHYPAVTLQWLVKDARGHEYAVATRIVTGIGSDWWGYGESYRWQDTEVDRLEPWVIQRVDAKDYYTAPQTPLLLLGVRFTFSQPQQYTIELSNVRPLPSSLHPQNYWAIGDQFGWDGLLAKNTPGLFFASLKLPGGNYTIRWECLDPRGWQVVAEGKTTLAYAGPADLVNDEPRLEFPRLPKGTYSLRIVAISDTSDFSKEYDYQYYSITPVAWASRPWESPAGKAPTGETPVPRGKLLHFATRQNSNIFATARDAVVNFTCANETPAGVIIAYSIFSPDQRELGKAEQPWQAGQPCTLALTPYLTDCATVRVQAEVRLGTKVLDCGTRLFGVTHTEAAPTKLIPAKKDWLKNNIVRTKGDWNEGGSPVNSQFALISQQLVPWLKDGQQTGYNAVELSAPWMEIEALPGIYDFSYLDRLIKQATGAGFQVILRVHALAGNVPLWAYADFQQDQFGYVHGLWNGNSNLIFGPASPNYNTALQAFCRHLAAHYAANPGVVGYTFATLFFDHGYLDHPWLNQYVDYSPAARENYVAYLRKVKKLTLPALNKQFGAHYQSWDAVTMPKPRFSFDANGQLLPRTDAEWQYFMAAKLAGIHDFRMGMFNAVRASDPYCQVGIYSDTDFRTFFGDEVTANGGFIAQGSMEEQFPPTPFPYRVRFEPHAKVAKSKETTDVGMTNLLFYDPNWNSLFNYWMLQWTMPTVERSVQDAEQRLKSWFTVCDILHGVQPATARASAKPLIVYSLDLLKYQLQHVFTPRLEDFGRPLHYELAKYRLDLDEMSSTTLSDARLKNVPYVMLPYYADMLTSSANDCLARYVRNGGTLIMEASAGRYDAAHPQAKDALLKALKLPTISAVKSPSADDTPALPSANNGVLPAGASIAFRTQAWQPPINDQLSPWIHTISRSFFRTYQPTPGNYQVIATFAGGKPAITLHPYGKGRVLVLWGTMDWFASDNSVTALHNWASRQTGAANTDNELLMNVFVKGSDYYVLGRRFIDHDLIEDLKSGNVERVKQQGQKDLPIRVPNLPAGQYQIKDILNGADYQTMTAQQLKEQGVTLNLYKGDAFVLQFKKI